MRIFTNDTQNYLFALAASVGRDPISLETWNFMHIHLPTHLAHTLSADALELVSDQLHADYKALDCDIIAFADNDLLLVYEHTDEESASCLRLELLSHVLVDDAVSETITYTLPRDWQEICDLLYSRLHDTSSIVMSSLTRADFGDIAVLDDVFHSVQKLKKNAEPLRIMLVDDDATTRHLFTRSFQERYAIITAKDAKEAVQNYLILAPDMVFLDINLPDYSGFSALEEILKHDPKAYVVMFSGNGYLDNVTHALSLGACGFVTKPLKKDRMRHYIDDCSIHSKPNV